MSAWSIELEHEELHTVWRIFNRSLETETPTDGLWVRSRDGQRIWSGTCGPLFWEVTGGASPQPLEPRCLPARLVWNAADLSLEADDRCVTISTPDDVVGLAANSAGSSVIDLPVSAELRRFPKYVTDAATATLTRKQLARLLGRISFAPPGIENPHRVPVSFIVEDGELAAYANWSTQGGLCTSQRVPAETRGEAKSSIPVLHLLDLIREVDDDELITIRFPADLDIPLLIEGEGWRATSDRRETTAVRFHDELGRTLADATGTTTRVLDTGVFSTTWRTRTIHAELHNTPLDTVRLSTVVLDGIEPTVDVLQQLNDVNAGLVGARVWLCDNVVVAGVDVPCSSISDIGGVIRQLDVQIDGLDVFLSALGAEAA
ncbi:MAG: hypothetical protein F2520_12055 [Actinobacteria bacterium]|uniref:Unannotated protein n=1 Tax=freshwater metagenome TaxID=449393 RepID=A0A6J7KIN1_9ZZZZ|nr:hypothetical protein [Actinomycetota bacterium]MTA78983.1 hypothetical protein [Actinomycetota bacterium]